MRSAGVTANTMAGDLSSLGANTAEPAPASPEGTPTAGGPTPPAAAGATTPP